MKMFRSVVQVMLILEAHSQLKARRAVFEDFADS